MPRSRWAHFDRHVATILLVALGVRIAAWWVLPYRGYISDEAEYLAAATWLAQGRGFSFFQGWIWTRPPLYVLFLAAHVKFFGPSTLWPIRLSQALLSTLTVWLSMRLGAALAPANRMRQVALTTGWAMALTYSFATFAFLLLSETLFIMLLLAALLALTRWAQRGGTRWLIVGGALLGLGSLTRAVLAGILPVFALWVLWIASREQGTGNREQGTGRYAPRATHHTPRSWRRGVRAAALLTIVVSGVILPWTAYNSRYYGGLILIDTTGGYNAMLGAQAARQEIVPAEECLPARPPRCEQAIYNALVQIPNQAQRQQAAYRTALRWISENPLGFARKAGNELIDLLLVNYGGAERLYRGYTLGEVPALHLLGLLLDDTLYVLAAPLAVLGLFRRQCRSGKGLVVAWLLYNLLTGPLFFAINRFRQPLLPFLFIYAACALWQLRLRWPNAARRWAGIGVATALALLLLPSYAYWPPVWGARKAIIPETLLGFQGLVDAQRCAEIERLINAGQLDAAQRLHDSEDQRRRVDVNSPDRRNCLALLNAQMLALRGQPQQALALLQSMRDLPERFLLEGDIYRAQGDLKAALNPFVARQLEPVNPTEWAWDHLHPPPTNRIDLGSGLDWGYIDGFYTREGRAEDPGNFRWSSADARLRFVKAGTGKPQTLRLRVDGCHAPTKTGCDTSSVPPAKLTVVMSGQTLGTYTTTGAWQTLEIPLPPTPVGQDVIVELRSTTFVPGPEELHARQQVGQQLRLLGARVDWAELTNNQ